MEVIISTSTIIRTDSMLTIFNFIILLYLNKVYYILIYSCQVKKIFFIV